MQEASSVPDFDIHQFKTVMTQEPTQENGWTLQYEGPVDLEFPDSTIKTYKKRNDAASGFTMRIDAVLKGVKAENIVTMQRDISYRGKIGKPPKQIKVVEKTSKNSDIIYIELGFPFPMTNRDIVQKRLFVSNKQDPELVQKLGLFDKSHAYHAVLIQSTEHKEYPTKEKPIRAETQMYHTLVEEDPNNKNVVRMKMVIQQQLNGDIPKVMINALGSKMPKTMITGLLTAQKKYFAKS